MLGGIRTDVLTVGLGADEFEFTRTSTDITLTDFDVGEGDALRFYNTGGAEFDASSVGLTANGIIVSYTDTASGTEHDISIALPRAICLRTSGDASAKTCAKGRDLQNLIGSRPNAGVSQIPIGQALKLTCPPRLPH